MWRSSCSPAWTSRPRSGSRGGRCGPRLGAAHHRPQRHLRGSPGRNRARLGHRGRVRGRRSTASASRPTAATRASPPSARSPATGWRLRRRARGALRRRPQRGRPRAEDSLESSVPAHFGLASPLELAGAIHTRQDRPASGDRARAARDRARRPIRSPAESSSGWRPRWRAGASRADPPRARARAGGSAARRRAAPDRGRRPARDDRDALAKTGPEIIVRPTRRRRSSARPSWAGRTRLEAHAKERLREELGDVVERFERDQAVG